MPIMFFHVKYSATAASNIYVTVYKLNVRDAAAVVVLFLFDDEEEDDAREVMVVVSR